MSAGSVLVLAGPTGVGKSALAIQVAQQVGAEIVSADSRQVYRGLDIGTATPTPEAQQGVPHHLLDELDPTQPVTAGWFARRAAEAIAEIQGRGHPVLVVGGSTLYVHALVAGLADLPSLDSALAAELSQIAEHPEGRQALYDELRRADPEAAATLDPSKSQRLVRLVGLVRQTGAPVSRRWREAASAPLPTRLVVLDRPRPALYQAIDARVDDMLEGGLLEEARAVLRRWPDAQGVLEATIGYRELLPVLRGERDLDDARRLIQRNSRRYAKRQLTWYRRYPQAEWVQADAVRAEDLIPADG